MLKERTPVCGSGTVIGGQRTWPFLLLTSGLMLVRFESGVTAPVKASEARHRDSESKNIDQRHFGHVQRQV
jgi:hypothetical protein